MDIEAELIRPLIERLDGRICVSEACIGSLTPYFPYAYDVIPNGIDADHFSPDAEPVADLMGDHQTIVFIGRFDPRNGVDTMIARAPAAVRRAGPGGAPDRDRRRPVAPRVRADQQVRCRKIRCFVFVSAKQTNYFFVSASFNK